MAGKLYIILKALNVLSEEFLHKTCTEMRIIMKYKYTIDTHTHTLVSGHAYNTIDEMAAYAFQTGVTHLAITDHAPKMPGSAGILYFSNMKIIPRVKNGVRIYMGCEANIMDYEGSIDLKEYGLKGCDVVIASLHIPCIRPGDIGQNTKALIKAMDNPYVNIIGHPDDSRYPVDYEQLVMAAKEKHVLLEVNNTSLNPDGPRQGAYENDIKMLKLCKQLGVCISIGSDAHIKESICNFDRAYKVLEETDFPEELIVNSDYRLYEEYIGRRNIK